MWAVFWGTHTHREHSRDDAVSLSLSFLHSFAPSKNDIAIYAPTIFTNHKPRKNSFFYSLLIHTRAHDKNSFNFFKVIITPAAVLWNYCVRQKEWKKLAIFFGMRSHETMWQPLQTIRFFFGVSFWDLRHRRRRNLSKLRTLNVIQIDGKEEENQKIVGHDISDGIHLPRMRAQDTRSTIILHLLHWFPWWNQKFHRIKEVFEGRVETKCWTTQSNRVESQHPTNNKHKTNGSH